MGTSALTIAGVAAVAALYASVGHGGASGYLAVMALIGAPAAAAKPIALMLNLVTAAISLSQFRAAGHLKGRILWPFAAASIPCSFLGAMIKVSPRTYGLLLAAALLAAAFRLAINVVAPTDKSLRPLPALPITLAIGAALGLLSGMAGVGGGIFLSPLLILARWADAKETAAVSAAFIWVNSAAGLLGQLPAAAAALPAAMAWVPAAAAGGLVGAHLGARRLPSPVLRRVLAAVLVTAAYKAFLRSVGPV